MIWLFVYVIVVVVVLGTLALGGILAAPWVPLWQHDVRRMLEVAKVGPTDVVYDLGAGDGRMIRLASTDFGATGFGYEIAVLPYLLGRVILAVRGIPRVQLRYGNFFSADMSSATVVTIFLLPKALAKLRPKLERELKPGTRVVSYAFEITGWTPERVDRSEPKRAAIYLYRR